MLIEYPIEKIGARRGTKRQREGEKSSSQAASWIYIRRVEGCLQEGKKQALV